MKLYASIWKDYTEDSLWFIGSFDVTRTLSFGTQLHGGFANASFSVPGARDRSFDLYRRTLGAHVVIFDMYGRRIYEGSVSNSALAAEGVTFDLVGYYSRASRKLDDRIYVDANTTVYDIIRDSVEYITDWNQKFAFVSDADYIVGAQDYTDKKVSEAIESVLKYGYQEADLRPVYFALWENRMGYLFPEPTPSTYPDWMISVANVADSTGLSMSLDQVYNKVYAVYDDQGQGVSKTTAAEDKLSQGRFGVIEGVVQNGGSPEGLALATDLRDMALERYKYPRQVLNLTARGFIRRGSGGYEYPYMVRAGDFILFTDLDMVTAQAGDLKGQAAQGISGFVLSTNYSADDNSVQIDFGSSDIKLETLMSRLGLSGGLR